MRDLLTKVNSLAVQFLGIKRKLGVSFLRVDFSIDHLVEWVWVNFLHVLLLELHGSIFLWLDSCLGLVQVPDKVWFFGLLNTKVLLINSFWKKWNALLLE